MPDSLLVEAEDRGEAGELSGARQEDPDPLAMGAQGVRHVLRRLGFEARETRQVEDDALLLPLQCLPEFGREPRGSRPGEATLHADPDGGQRPPLHLDLVAAGVLAPKFTPGASQARLAGHPEGVPDQAWVLEESELEGESRPGRHSERDDRLHPLRPGRPPEGSAIRWRTLRVGPSSRPARKIG